MNYDDYKELLARDEEGPGPDRIIAEDFPDGWFVEDRPREDTALLCGPGGISGTHCICQRPNATRTEDWLPIARDLAQAVSATNTHSVQ